MKLAGAYSDIEALVDVDAKEKKTKKGSQSVYRYENMKVLKP